MPHQILFCIVVDVGYQIQLLNSFQMSMAHTFQSVNCTIDILLDKGASKLYDKYINQKLPQHTHVQNNATFYNNLSLSQVDQPARTAINPSPVTTIDQIPIDNRAPKRISVKKQIDSYSTLSPKNTTFNKSTKYQTIIKSQKESVDRQKNIQNMSDSMNFQEQNLGDIPISVRKGRPMTIQTARHHNNLLNIQSNLEEVEQKRAMTCHTRKRKPITVNREKPQKFFKIEGEVPAYIRQEIQLTNRLRKHKKDRQQQQNQQNHQKDKLDAYVLLPQKQIRLKEKKTKQNFQELKSKLKSRNKQYPALTNVETDSGNVVINGKPKQLKTHIVQLQFNPEEEHISRKMQSKVQGVNGTKKSSFVAKLKKKQKITNQQFTNNGGRQISSIPFISLNCGIVLSQSTIEATACRRRPTQEVTRQQFTIINESQRFKSHNPLVSSTRVNVYATLDQAAGQTVKSSFFQNTLTDRKQFQTTLDSRKQMTGSILWRVRQKSEHKKIKISNVEAFNNQILQIKLAH